MGMRPRSAHSALRPFFESSGEADAAAASDSGGASFLGQVSARQANSGLWLGYKSQPL